jgi:hypothetical protein
MASKVNGSVSSNDQLGLQISPIFISDQELLPARASDKTSLYSRMTLLPGAGVFLAALSGMFFATGSLIVKLVPEIHPIEIVCFR